MVIRKNVKKVVFMENESQKSKKELRLAELSEIFSGVDEEQKKLISPLIDEVVFLEGELDYLKTLPQIRVHPQDPTRQKITDAARLYKKRQESYMNAVRILLSVLYKVETSEQDRLAELLKQFE